MGANTIEMVMSVVKETFCGSFSVKSAPFSKTVPHAVMLMDARKLRNRV